MLDTFFRKKVRGRLSTRPSVPLRPRFAPESELVARLRLLWRRSERLLCIRRIATPFSSVAKSNPRCTDRTPVDISVLLAERRSMEGLGSEVMLPIRLWLRVRDVNDAVTRRFREGRVLRS